MQQALPAPEITASDRLGLTLFFAIVAHALVIFGVTFAPEDHPAPAASTLDIVLVQHRSDKAPKDPQHIAQANQDGGGNSDKPVHPVTPLPAPLVSNEAQVVATAPPLPPTRAEVLAHRPPAPSPPPARKPVRKPPPLTRKPAVESPAPRHVLAQKVHPSRRKVHVKPVNKTRRKALLQADRLPVRRDAPKRDEPKLARRPAPSPRTPPVQAPSADTLVSRSLAMASLSAEIDQKLVAYARRPRQKWITARTRESKYAAYMEAWRLKVERVGNLNYPDEARRRRLSGSLLLDVGLNSDGSIHSITLRRSSGYKVLDDAAIRIVKLAAPFAKFPKDIAAETDILHIERTWRFLSNDSFSGG